MSAAIPENPAYLELPSLAVKSMTGYSRIHAALLMNLTPSKHVGNRPRARALTVAELGSGTHPCNAQRFNSELRSSVTLELQTTKSLERFWASTPGFSIFGV